MHVIFLRHRRTRPSPKTGHTHTCHIHRPRKETLYIFIVLPADRYLTIYLYCCICYLNPLPNHTPQGKTHPHTLLIIICRLRLQSTLAWRDLRSHGEPPLMESRSGRQAVSQGATRQLDSFTPASDCILVHCRAFTSSSVLTFFLSLFSISFHSFPFSSFRGTWS